MIDPRCLAGARARARATDRPTDRPRPTPSCVSRDGAGDLAGDAAFHSSGSVRDTDGRSPNRPKERRAALGTPVALAGGMSKLSLYETTYALVQVVREGLMASGRDAPELVRSAWTAVAMLRVVACEALRVAEPRRAIRRLRDAEIVVDILRHHLYEMLCGGALATEMFDEAMVAASRCRQAIAARVCEVRRDVWAELHQIA